MSSPKNDGIIILDEAKDLNGQPIRWREIAPMRYRDVNGQEETLFKRAADGHFDLVGLFPVFIRRAFPDAGQEAGAAVAIASLSIIALR